MTDGHKEHKILSVAWWFEDNQLVINLQTIGRQADDLKVTKRNVIRLSARVLGIVSLVVLQMKLIFQELCVKELDWDDQLPEDLARRWSRLMDSLRWRQ